MRTSHRGVYSGAVQFYFGDRLEQRYPATVRAITDCRFLALPAGPFAAVFREWYPMAVHLLEGMFVGQRNSAELVGQRERLLALGKLTAGLTHELNNPAAAAARATDALRERFAGMRHKLAMLSEGKLDGAVLRSLTGLQEEFVAPRRERPRAHRAGALGPGGRGWPTGSRSTTSPSRGRWPASSSRPGSGPRTSTASPTPSPRPSWRRRCAGWPTPSRPSRCSVEITDSTHRISALVDAAKQYSQMDRTPHQPTDLHAGLDATLVMLGAQDPARASRWSRTTTGACRRCPRTPASSTRCGPT